MADRSVFVRARTGAASRASASPADAATDRLAAAVDGKGFFNRRNIRRMLVALLVALVALPLAAGTRDAQTAFESGEYDRAYKLWLEEAKEGDPQAQYGVGYLSMKGKGTRRDPTAAVRWYERAAQQGHGDAMYALGLAMRNGEGVRRDYVGAAGWFRQAAMVANNREAQYQLGLMYFNGEGVPLSFAQAVRHFRAAADRGHAGAEYVLATMYESGFGVRPSRVKAYYWYQRAGNHPVGTLADYSKEFDVRQALGELRGRMNHFQVAEANRLLRQDGVTPRQVAAIKNEGRPTP